jgi:uncharacterized membrane protein YidH (DUF202 family)
MHDIPYSSFFEERIRTIMKIAPYLCFILLMILIIHLFSKEKKEKEKKLEIRKNTNTNKNIISMVLVGLFLFSVPILSLIFIGEICVFMVDSVLLSLCFVLIWYVSVERWLTRYHQFNERFNYSTRFMITLNMSCILFFLPYGYFCAIEDLGKALTRKDVFDHQVIVLSDSHHMCYLRVLGNGVLAIEKPSSKVIFVPMEKISQIRFGRPSEF